MADNSNNNGNGGEQQQQQAKPGNNGLTLETEISRDSTFAGDLSISGSGTPSFAERDGATGLEIDMGAPGRERPAAEGDTTATSKPQEGEEGKEKGGDAEDKTEQDEQVAEALPAYDPENEEVRTAYEGRYVKEDGNLNEQALSDEFWRNYGKDPKAGGLNEDTYKFLQDSLGISKNFAKQVEKALVVEANQQSQAIANSFGGAEAVQKAIEWARKGAYSKEQQARYNAAVAKGGEDLKDQLEILMARYNKAQDNKSNRNFGRNKFRKGPQSPQRTTGSAGGAAETPAGEPFESQEAYRSAFAEASRKVEKAKGRSEREAAMRERDALHDRARQFGFKQK